MATCITKAWGSHIASSAWWVYASQVSKAAQPGEYVTKGSFIIRGKKNYLPSCPLVLGFGILFRVDEISAEKHRKQSQEQAQNLSEMEPEEYTAPAPTDDNDESTLEEYTANPPTNDNGEGDLDGEEEYPDISLDVPTVRLQVEEENPDEYSIIEFANKTRAKKTNVPKKELETKEYLEKKAEEERKAAAAKKVGKRQKHKLEKIRKKYKDQDEEEREMRLMLLGSRGKQKSDDGKGVNGEEVGDKHPSAKNNKGVTKGERQRPQKPELEDMQSTNKENATDLNREKNHDVSGKNGDEADEAVIKIEDSAISDSAQEDVVNGDSKNEVQDGPNDPSTATEQNPSSQTKDAAVGDGEGGKGAENDDDEEDLKTTSEGTEALVSQLISNPEPDDVLLYAVTMVFQNFKYKVKLTPGSSKKGKAGKLAIDLFL
ncbi:unnamed protein product, partial [Cylicostephanus goldi]